MLRLLLTRKATPVCSPEQDVAASVFRYERKLKQSEILPAFAKATACQGTALRMTIVYFLLTGVKAWSKT